MDVSGESDCEPGGGDPMRLREEDSQVVPKRMLDPRWPNQDEVDRHNLTHSPYRIWCPICVKAEGNIWIIEKKRMKSGECLKTVLTIVTPEMSLDGRGQFWLAKKGPLVYCVQPQYLPKDLVGSSLLTKRWFSGGGK